MRKESLIGPHGIDLRAPGGLEALFAFNRALFGDATMEDGTGGTGAGAGGQDGGAAGAGAGAGGDGADGGAGTGGQGGAGDGAPGDEQLGEAGLRALKAERDKNKDLQARIKTLEDASLTEEQKRDAKLTGLESTTATQAATIASHEAMILRYEIAEAKGLDLAAAKRLVGSTREELEADADAFKDKFMAQAGGRHIPGAGAAGSTTVQTSPGMGTLRAGYENSK